MTEITERYHNYTYAPGISTYGIPGEDGKLGEPGTSIFYTSYNIDDGTDAKNCAIKLANNYLPIESSDVPISRDYRTGDLLISSKSKIYKIKNIDKIYDLAYNNNIESTLVFEYLGSLESLNDIISSNSNRSYIKGNYKGLDIVDNLSISSSPKAILNLMSGNDHNTGDIDFLNMDVVYGSVPNANLRIYYDKDLQSFHFDSSYPIVFDSNIYVNYTEDSPDVVDEYSKIVTNENPITSFYGICNKLNYSIDTSVFSYNHPGSDVKYYGSLYKITIGSKSDEEPVDDLLKSIVNDEPYIHFQYKDFLDFLKLIPDRYEYWFKLNQEYKNPYDAQELIKIFKDHIMVSLVNNIEVYIKKNNDLETT